MRRPYSGLSRRDRAIDAQAMAERAEAIGPLLDAAEATPATAEPQPKLWSVRRYELGKLTGLPKATERFETELGATARFDEIVRDVRENGGEVELLKDCICLARVWCAARSG